MRSSFLSRALTAALGLLLVPAAFGQARLQVIHNAADPAAAEVDVYVNGALLLDDFAFRTATPFIDVPSGTDLEVAVAPGTSTSAGDALFTDTLNLPAGSTTQLIANGVLDPSAFAANPDGRPTAFALLVGADAQEGRTGRRVAVRAVHGATDAPTVDLVARDRIYVDNAAYSDVTGYLAVPAGALTVTVTTAEGTPVASYGVDLTGAEGGAVTVLASGFLTPGDDQNGPAFGILAVFADGTTALLPPASPPLTPLPTTGIVASGTATAFLDAPYPNPTATGASVTYALAEAGPIRLSVVDALGREVAVLAEGQAEATPQTAPLDARSLAPGTYLIRLAAEGRIATQRLTITR